MGAALTPSGSYTGTVPSIADGDAASGAIFTAPIQALYNSVDSLNTTANVSGVKRLQTFASVAALRAYTGQTDGDFAAVGASSTAPANVAVFRFAANGFLSTTDDGVTCIAPASGTGGRWFAVGLGKGALNVANGVPQLDSTTQQAANTQHGALLSSSAATQSIATNTTGGGIGTGVGTGIFVGVACNTGDVCVINGDIESAITVGSGTVYTTIQANSTTVPGSWTTNGLTVTSRTSVGGVFVAPSNATYNFQIYLYAGSSITVQFGVNTAFSVLRYAALCRILL